ncbi:histidine phosphatase family protein [Pusillimonas sp. TS35]|uniref:histidine phosphatase family protein n=1 Tax=Paracandidimonas lactea TaxID=2895524 RepID=UPI001370E79E|nr:histidine phosphatase family protein [Paracandidimonas lactea]MYN13250.1 histidine phosphatase family protein [Pusillimonas sp. TS35]
MSTTTFWLIRHGETQWNAERRLQGWRDIPLNETGLRQARQLGQVLRPPHFTHTIDVIVSSDLSRAHDTARIASAHLALSIEACIPLRERNYGIYEGKNWASLETLDGPAVNFHAPQWQIEQGESLLQFNDRIVQAFETLAHAHSGRNVLVFAHGGVIDIVWRHASGASLEARRPAPILNASINQFSINADSTWALLDWGRVAHLNEAALDDVI